MSETTTNHDLDVPAMKLRVKVATRGNNMIDWPSYIKL